MGAGVAVCRMTRRERGPCRLVGTTEYILNLWPELLATSETGDFRQHLCKIKDYHHNIDEVQVRVG